MTGEAPSVRAELAVQALSVALQRENARAIVRRAVGTAPLAAPLAAARQQLQSAAATNTNFTDVPFPVLANAATLANPTDATAVYTANLDPASSRVPCPPLCTPAPACSLSCSPPALCATPVSGAAPAAVVALPAAPPLPVGGTPSATSPNDSSHLSCV